MEVHSERTRDNGHNLPQNKVQLELRGKNVTMVVAKHLKTGSQRGCELSVAGDFQNLIGLSPEQPEITLKITF